MCWLLVYSSWEIAQWGYNTVYQTVVTVSFPIAYQSLYTIVAQQFTGPDDNDANDLTDVIKTNPTTSSFTVCKQSSNMPVAWVALGK